MDCEYDIENRYLCIDGNNIPAYDDESNEVGICSVCQSELISISYHSFEDKILVVSRCNNCRALFAIIFDDEWDWMEEIPITQFYSVDLDSSKTEINEDLELLESIPAKKLECVFSPSEIDAMFTKAKGEKCVRQYLYRARKKYPDFEELFGIRFEI